MRTHKRTDRGSVLPLVLIVVVVMSMVVVGIARYGTSNLRYSQVAEQRSDQLAAADAAMSYAVNLIRIGRADCIFDNSAPVALPALVEDFNGATGSATCDAVSGGLDSAPVFALALTGEGVPNDKYLVNTQGGGTKEINGPVFMERATNASLALTTNNGLDIFDAPLVHSTDPCSAATEAILDAAEPWLRFVPDVFGPQCITDNWYDYGSDSGDVFDEPPINIPNFAPMTTVNTGGLAVLDGSAPLVGPATWPPLPLTDGSPELVTVSGAYEDVGLCRVYHPGWYVRPPQVDGIDAYFMSGDYVFDFRDPDDVAPTSFETLRVEDDAATEGEFRVDNSVVLAGALDSSVTSATVSYEHSDCDAAIAADESGGRYGATFYMSGRAHLRVLAGGAMEIMPRDRNQGTTEDPFYVSLHALCNGESPAWCSNSPTTIGRSTLTAPTTDPWQNILYTQAGKPASIVVNGLIYAPKAELRLDNTSNNGQAKFKGGMVLARATLQASASAENFEIGVTLQDIDFGFRLTATGTDQEGRSTTITSALDYTYGDPYATAVDVTSWRVCESGGC